MSQTIAAECLNRTGLVYGWWHATDFARQIVVRWSPAQLWMEIGDGPTFIVVKNNPTYEDVKRLVESLGIEMAR